MSFTRSVSVPFAAALCLSTALVMGGCSSKDEGPSATKSSPANPLGLKGALLSLGESSTSGLSWDKMSGSDGNYSYSGLVVKDGSNSLNIKSANLIGVHMDGETASFDRADFSGITVLDTEENVTVTMDSFSVARPSPAMARSIIEGLSNIKKIDDLDLDIDDEDMSFGAIGMSGPWARWAALIRLPKSMTQWPWTTLVLIAILSP